MLMVNDSWSFFCYIGTIVVSLFTIFPRDGGDRVDVDMQKNILCSLSSPTTTAPPPPQSELLGEYVDIESLQFNSINRNNKPDVSSTSEHLQMMFNVHPLDTESTSFWRQTLLPCSIKWCRLDCSHLELFWALKFWDDVSIFWRFLEVFRRLGLPVASDEKTASNLWAETTTEIYGKQTTQRGYRVGDGVRSVVFVQRRLRRRPVPVTGPIDTPFMLHLHYFDCRRTTNPQQQVGPVEFGRVLYRQQNSCCRNASCSTLTTRLGRKTTSFYYGPALR